MALKSITTMSLLEEWRRLLHPKKSIQIYIPDEIIEQILSKLPAKSLLRFKDVGKRWHSLISNPYFVQSHLQYLLSVPEYHQKIMILINSFNLINYDGNQYDDKCNLPLSIRANRKFLLGSCNGLICFGLYYPPDPHLLPLLWNPLFNEYLQVPFVHSFRENWFGFGYDSHSEDYKFVIANLEKKEAEVYSLKSASKRSLPFQLCLVPYNDEVQDVGKIFNGSIYWLFSSTLKYLLVEFDLRYEKFRFHEVPNYIPRIDGVILGILKDSVAICFGEPENKTYFNLVKMKKYGLNDDKISWIRVKIQYPQGMRVEHRQGRTREPLGLMMNGEFIMRFRHYKDDTIKYNEQKGTIMSFMSDGWEDCVTYNETLVLPSKLIDVVDEQVRTKSKIRRVLNKFVSCTLHKSY